MKFIKSYFFNLPYFILYILFFFHKKNQNIALEFLFSKSKINLSFSFKRKLLKKLILSFDNIESATSLESNITLLKYGLENIDPKSDGYIVECGCFKGASSVTLSILAKLTNRKLIIYDSFEGLPDIDKFTDSKAYYPHIKKYTNYKKGMYSGTLDEVKNNISNFGYIDNCIFIKGYFSKTLINHKENIDFLFIDVDLLSSLESCLLHLWKYLKKDSFLFTDDSCDLNLVKLWFDESWWRKNHNESAPGYIGSGCGIPLKGNYSSLGYTKKHDKDNYDLTYWS